MNGGIVSEKGYNQKRKQTKQAGPISKKKPPASIQSKDTNNSNSDPLSKEDKLVLDRWEKMVEASNASKQQLSFPVAGKPVAEAITIGKQISIKQHPVSTKESVKGQPIVNRVCNKGSISNNHNIIFTNLVPKTKGIMGFSNVLLAN